MDKNYLRIYAKNTRKSIDIDEFSLKVTNEIIRNADFIEAKNVMLFYPLKDEPNLLKLLDFDKNFYLPRISKNILEVCPYKKGDTLIKSNFNVMEPITVSIDPEVLDLVIVPALMADKRGYRLGYGKVYYDRFLNGKSVKTICAVPNKLYVEKLPCDEFDQKIDTIITDF